MLDSAHMLGSCPGVDPDPRSASFGCLDETPVRVGRSHSGTSPPAGSTPPQREEKLVTMHLGSPQTPIAMFEPIQSSTVKNRPPEPAPTLRTGRRSRTANSTKGSA